jgi:L-lysine 2,3-aminomutase
MRPGDALDPLLRQVLPTPAELVVPPGFTSDPTADAQAVRASGLLAKYPARTLIVATRSCGVHCRFCFRRHFRYPPAAAGLASLEPALAEIARDASIHEVILSGGDPLTLDDPELAALIGRLASIDHLKRLRVHTRLPIVVPQRVTEGLVAALCGGDCPHFRPAGDCPHFRPEKVDATDRPRRRKWGLSPSGGGQTSGRPLPTYLVLHVNHPCEIDQSVARAIARLADAGVPLLAQTVLLRGVNDKLDVLAELFETLVNLRVLPYYLHQLDRVAGAAHFEVSRQAGFELIAALRQQLPGYVVPRYVEETPGMPNKCVLA